MLTQPVAKASRNRNPRAILQLALTATALLILPWASASSATAEDKPKGLPITAAYDKGLRIKSEGNKFAARIRWRVQMRASDLNSNNLVGEPDGIEKEAGFRIRRARFKLDGHAYEPWLKYYLEYGIQAGAMLTWQFDVNRYEKASLRVGQWKVVYNRERVDSSGSQQFVERSIVNRPFTVDRQQGIHLTGRLFKGTTGDSRYWAGVYTGTGRGGGLDSNRRPMYVARWQWNFLKRDVPFSQSDIKYTPKTIASLAVAGSTNEGSFTRWSSSGGGQLAGLGGSEYKTDQWMAEFAMMRKGLSVQSEYHEKEIKDNATGAMTELDGSYAQVGYFFHAICPGFPKGLELAARIARVDVERSTSIPVEREAMLAVNYFFSGHYNKLTADIAHLKSRIGNGREDDGWRLQLQWDVTF